MAHKLNLEHIRQRRKDEDQWNQEKRVMEAEYKRKMEEKDVQLEEVRRQLAAAVVMNKMWEKRVGKIV